MSIAHPQIERVRYIGMTQAVSLYTLYQNESGGWCCEVLDQKNRPTFHHGPFGTRGQAIQTAEWHIDNVTVHHRA
jgi:hypothetical protein